MTVSTSQSIDAPMLYRTDTESVATITLNKPDQYNPLSWDMLTQIQETLDSIAQDESIRVVILAAKGRAFCAGHDLKEIRKHDNDEFSRKLFAKCSRMMLTMTQIPQPVIASVQGIATAAGCQLVANCDLAIASTQSRFAVSGINLGLFCSTPGGRIESKCITKKRI